MRSSGNKPYILFPTVSLSGFPKFFKETICNHDSSIYVTRLLVSFEQAKQLNEGMPSRQKHKIVFDPCCRT